MKKLNLCIITLLFFLNVSNTSGQVYTPPIYTNSPGIEWRRSDYLTKTPDNASGTRINVTLDRDCGSNDWWYDVKNSKDGSGNPDGYIVCGYSNPFDYQIRETGLGCLYNGASGTMTCSSFWPTISCPNPILTYSAMSTIQTIAKYDLYGRQLWMRTYNEGTFNRIIQTSDGNYLAVGGTKSTRDLNGTTPLPYNDDGISSTTINCLSPTTMRHMSMVKIDVDGNIIFNKIYGELPISSSLFLTANAEGTDVVEFNIGTTNPLCRIVGHHSDYGGADEESVMIDIDNTTGLISAGPRNFSSSGNDLLFQALDVYGTYPNEVFAVSGELESSTAVAYLAYFSNSTITTTPTTASYTSSLLDDAESYDVCFNSTGDILLPVLEKVVGHFAEGAVYRVNPTTFGNTKMLVTPYTGSPANLCAFDLRLSIIGTNDGGFAVCSVKRPIDYATEWGSPSFYCSYTVMDYWNSNGFISKFNSSNLIEWEKIFDVDEASPSYFDARKKECLFSIAQTPEGGYIMAGNNSYNADDNYLIKIYPDCELRRRWDIVGTDEPKKIVISSPTTWSSSASILGSVIVQSGASLTISGSGTVIEFADTKRTGIVTNIVVETKALLTVTDNAVLTADQSCEDAMWDGIQILGDPGKNQNTGNQGKIIVNKDARIEHARAAILVGEGVYSTHRNTDLAGFKISSLVCDATGIKGGGIVITDLGHFLNNRKSIVFDPYNFTVSNNSQIRKSEFLNTSFMRDRFFVDNLSRRVGNNTFIVLNNTRTMPIADNTFTNSIAYTDLDYASRGWGISMGNADGYVIRNSFTSNTYGIVQKAYNTTYSLLADQNSFLNNFGGINSSASKASSLTRNNFTVGLDLTNNEYGIYLGDCSGYTVQENTMVNVDTKLANGIVDNYSSTPNTELNMLYKNSFDRFDYGLNMSSHNRGSGIPSEGLKFKCNTFINGKNYDAAVTFPPGVSVVQGGSASTSDPAGNTFSNTCNWFDANLSEAFNTGFYDYFYHFPGDVTDPGLCYDNTFITTFSTGFFFDETSCPSKFGEPCKPPCDEKYLLFKEKYEELLGILDLGQGERIANLQSEGSSNQQASSIGANDSLNSLLANYRIEYEDQFNQLVNYYTVDTLASNLDSVAEFLKRDRNPSSKFRLSELYIRQEKFVDAIMLLNDICSDSQYDNYCSLQNLLIQLKQAGLPDNSIKTNPQSMAIVEFIASDTTKYGYFLARNLLSSLDERNYPEHIYNIQSNAFRKSDPDKFSTENEELTISPVPANETVKISVMKSDDLNRNITISTLSGKILKTISVNSETEFVIHRNELGADGIYLVKLTNNNKSNIPKKIIFIK